MFKKLILSFLSLMFLFSNATPFKAKTNYYAHSYMVMDSKTNTILEQSNSEDIHSVASISKIMTALIAIENNDLNKIVKAGPEIKKAYGSMVYLVEDEEITISELIYGLMLRSGNDTAVVLAIATSKTMDAFVIKMNERAKKIGMTKTKFINPHGLDDDDEGNRSTAKDMALLMSECLKNPFFRQVSGSLTYKSMNHGVWENKNRLLKSYELATGGKTGYTTKARRTLVTSAKKNNTEIVVVTINCGSDFEFHKDRYQYWLNKVQSFEVFPDNDVIYDQYLIQSKEKMFYLSSNDKNFQRLIEIQGNKAKIYLLDGNQKIYIGERNVEPIKEEVKQNLNIFEQFFLWFKNLFV